MEKMGIVLYSESGCMSESVSPFISKNKSCKKFLEINLRTENYQCSTKVFYHSRASIDPLKRYFEYLHTVLTDDRPIENRWRRPDSNFVQE